ncbi:MAG: DUF2095 family protein [Archaeoglobales archaeon]|nr:DUF2095 family protein [Archaeoglobales archaeon]
MEIEKEKFRKMFPNLYREIEDGIPTIFDHFEICKDEVEALEVVEFFEKTGEITHEFAAYLKNNISQFSYLFGTRKRGDYARRGLL